MISKYPRIVIVGAGIIGTSLAYHLAHQNASVTLIDKATRPANEATEKSFAWIVNGHNASAAYSYLRQQAIADWHRVEDELNGQLKINWSGALTWYENMAEIEHTLSELINFGYQVRFVDEQEIRLLEPNLKNVPAQAIFAKNEGAIDPTLTTELFIKAARETGADIQLGNQVLAFMTNGSRITGVVTANGNVTADIVIVAAGAGTTTLCQLLDLTVPVNISPAILMKFLNNHRFVNRIVSNPFMEIRATSDTRVMAAENYIDESPENHPEVIAQRTLKEIKKHWQGAEQIKLTNVTVGKRPIPRDGLPIIGRTTDIDGLYLLVMHSGVTLAAIAGRLAAAEILHDRDDILLSPYRLKRFN